MNPSDMLLFAQSVTASRQAEDGQPKVVLKKTTLGVGAGELLAIVGPSGSGKSTFLRLMNRLLEPDDGIVYLEGQDIRSLEPPVLRAQLPLVAQKPFLYAGTVQNNLEAPAKFRSTQLPDWKSEAALGVLDMCRIDRSWLGRDARKLSIGQQQRVCLARALLGPCKVLLLDEPTSALDRPTADKLAETFRRLCDEMELAIVLVTHDLRIAANCADRIALMQNGEVVESGLAPQVLNQPTTEAARRFLMLESITGDGEDE